MNIAFTLCSINYLAQAKSLSDTMRKTNPDWRFIYGIVDKNVSNVDLSFLDGETLFVEDVAIAGFDDMVKRYTIVELVTSVKPYYFSYLFASNPEVDKIAYFDPDIKIYQPLTSLEQKLDEFDIILTPHFTDRIPQGDNALPTEIHIFNTGVFNLGFLAVKRSENTTRMLTWWEDKLRYDCIVDLTRGYFVDQLWMNLVPAYFDKVLIDKYPGYNMAHWNLHDRILSKGPDGYLVNGSPLVFYHFSHYNPGKPEEIAAYHNRFNFATRPDLKGLYDDYRAGLLSHKYFEMKKVRCFYMNDEEKKKRNRKLENFLRQALPMGMKSFLRKITSK